jgi:serine/threonine protein kinase
MAAMEAARPPLLHRDLKPTNIFIGAQPRRVWGLAGLRRPRAAAT